MGKAKAKRPETAPRRTMGIRRGRADGCAFRDEVAPVIELTQDVWLATARAAAREIHARTGEVTIDDVRERVPPPPKADPRIMGAVFNRADWECLHYVKSARKSCHNRPIGVFALRA